MHRVAKFYRWMTRLRHPLTVSYALLTLVFAAMGTYFAYQVTVPHLEDYLGKWYGYYEWENSDGSRTKITGDTHFFANGLQLRW
ncbi:hypothetical protein QRD25_23930 (plasmid) [Serratia marcescens]|uniref:hypothetical protein n=1 Tax=Serratia TaxID=613 RepID=UPI0025705A12|nr:MULTISPECIES: hypothetical protein [Serratia]MDM1819202.1 hypothetical protein [Serratia ureilytica]WJD90509.1 hypothetical protein QRD25_23930 [Serratia marcescens]